MFEGLKGVTFFYIVNSIYCFENHCLQKEKRTTL